MKPLNPSRIRRILIISLSNIGDVILTLPVADILRRDFPDAKISIVVGPKVKSLFKNTQAFEHVIPYNKHQSVGEKFKWIMKLRKYRFDLVVDLRNSAIPFLLSPKYRTPVDISSKKSIHMRLKHLKRLRTVHPFTDDRAQPQSLYVSDDDRQFVDETLEKYVGASKPFVVMSPGSADQAKRWSKKGFAEVAEFLTQEHGLKTVFVGDREDRQVVQAIRKLMDSEPVDLCGRTTLIQTAEIVRRSRMALVNDSAVQHLASYLDVPVLAIFGYTDPLKYGPWGTRGGYLQPHGVAGKTEGTTEERVALIESVRPADVIRCIQMRESGVRFLL